MTALRGYIASDAEGGVLGVHSLDSFTFSVPDLAQAETFHASFGLDVRQDGNGLALCTFGHSHTWCRIAEGPHKSLGYLSFGIFEQDLARFARRLGDLGVHRLDPPRGLESNGIWFRDPDGTLVELKVAAKSSPDTKGHGQFQSSPPGVAGAPARRNAPATRPNRMSHVLLFTADVDRAVKFYESALGLALSDRTGNEIAFLHGRHGSDHHLVAFVRSTGPGIHHTSWEVDSLNAIGLGAMQMADKGFSRGWGLGRHVLGSNYFHYVRDPWGSYAEYSCDMDFIPKNMEWRAGDHDAEDAFYIWGPTPPDDFAVNHELRGR
ncbi:MAG: metapyrocatechase [Mesorhizobium sp.]|uniref:VOC family protein n=2 Tax=Mesorhizobium TaxID=68287 RepID=UPI000F764AE5|nr:MULTISPECIES: VOC family protein [unclassified Mesorhizobium]RVC71067.1 metapyrocatechase [Mesorhizobium sp. M00.F.Ca.ET.038.03.1.1]AZO34797.1 metapyrocatechase [Mesorhizobium sp. M2A.F.Ca.ET.046.03.2.1]RVD41884.1 metapyrocatechase [Mesorhizobium sp. M4B.F.Ca.ET.019.03.1.1]RWE21424.1 MAG: metapyrocatechase [Mesorhizobium sp.]RWE99570.1 MAG: metapyrocatechase [Mesorhizobium sp.]